MNETEFNEWQQATIDDAHVCRIRGEPHTPLVAIWMEEAVRLRKAMRFIAKYRGHDGNIRPIAKSFLEGAETE